MTPINLEDVESYLVKWVKDNMNEYMAKGNEKWLRDRFAELRAREAAVIRGP